ncbi:hypothetical protein ElyMa_000513500 [Elysia marginata]|uniref:Uncharacterized protein n=1 Tax=Elysia marginata TaxID=1093978 RepID=A0AAV4FX05_9GAST|nr:hypothetical protein ElyMa_000513500 [Elysia marginata]
MYVNNLSQELNVDLPTQDSNPGYLNPKAQRLPLDKDASPRCSVKELMRCDLAFGEQWSRDPVGETLSEESVSGPRVAEWPQVRAVRASSAGEKDRSLQTHFMKARQTV